MEKIDQTAFRYALSSIDDGFIFEEFAQAFLAALLGHDFIPVGGTKDRGIDGFQHIFSPNNRTETIYQMSTELGFEEKICSTIDKLKKNGISFDRFIYVTNRKLSNIESVINDLWDKAKINVNIYDEPWFVARCAHSQAVINAYQSFLSKYMHEYSRPGYYRTIADLDTDSRLYVFLKQQFSERTEDVHTDDLVIDSLILFSLEGTDPDKEILMTESEIFESIKKYISFSPELIRVKLRERLIILSTKPRKIKFHSAKKGYCLPYETRCEIENRNLKEESIYTLFRDQSITILNKFLKEQNVATKDVYSLIEGCLRTIFKKQGLEFSNFVINGDSSQLVEQHLDDVIGQAVDASSVIVKNKQRVKEALHLAIREIVYHGTAEQHAYLRSLSNTYMMMFLMKWEPKITTYFESLSSKLVLFVDTSILIPAFSEYYLDDCNKRFWNLLIGAYKAGITLFIYESHMDELLSHLQMIKNKYYCFYYPMEDVYVDETNVLFIDEIMIRAYYYAKLNNCVDSFDNFLNNFISPELGPNVKRELTVYLKEELGITFVSKSQWNIKIDDEEVSQLVEELSEKKNEIKARNDAEMILSLYALREKNNETSDTGILGYKTWWLSQDTSTYKAMDKCFGTKYPVSCYIRPDFVYNYITLSPSTEDINKMYDQLFPTMLGVNLSYHLPDEVMTSVQKKLKDFHGKKPVRIKQILNELSDKLKTTALNGRGVELFLDKKLQSLSVSD